MSHAVSIMIRGRNTCHVTDRLQQLTDSTQIYLVWFGNKWCSWHSGKPAHVTIMEWLIQHMMSIGMIITGGTLGLLAKRGNNLQGTRTITLPDQRQGSR